jgi:hypothetical protein
METPMTQKTAHLTLEGDGLRFSAVAGSATRRPETAPPATPDATGRSSSRSLAGCTAMDVISIMRRSASW